MAECTTLIREVARVSRGYLIEHDCKPGHLTKRACVRIVRRHSRVLSKKTKSHQRKDNRPLAVGLSSQGSNITFSAPGG